MRGNFKMLLTVFCVTSICSVVHSSGGHQFHHLQAPVGSAPVVTASSSQYFERTFNRLVAAPPLVPVAPAPPYVPVAPQPPLVHVAPAPSVFVHTAQALPAPLPPPQVIQFQTVQPVQTVPIQPAQPAQPAQPVEPNVSIAIATAHAAPVAIFLLPPYPFGFPPGYGLIPQEPPNNGDGKSQEPEQTTTKTTTQVDVQTTIREPETTTPLPAGSDTNFDQASSNQDPNFNQFLVPASPRPQPSNQGVNFRQYLAPAPLRPQGQPSNQNVNFRQNVAPAPLRPQGQPSNQNVNFRENIAPAQPRPQPLPSNENVNFRQYLPPDIQRPQLQPQPQQHLPFALPQPHHHHHDHHHHPHIYVHGKPQKLKTVVEVVKAPLAYIAPPAIPQYHHNHEAVKVVKHVHTFVPAKAKLIIRPVSHHHTRSIPFKIIEFKNPLAIKAAPRADVIPGNAKEAEFTTFRPFLLPITKPPRL